MPKKACSVCQTDMKFSHGTVNVLNRRQCVNDKFKYHRLVTRIAYWYCTKCRNGKKYSYIRARMPTESCRHCNMVLITQEMFLRKVAEKVIE